MSDAEMLMVAFTFFLAVFSGCVAVFTWWVKEANDRMAVANERLAWFTAAMESHSFLMLRLQAQEHKIPTTWWDPTKEPWPGTGPHRSPAELSEIRLGMRPSDRVNAPSSGNLR